MLIQKQHEVVLRIESIVKKHLSQTTPGRVAMCMYGSQVHKRKDVQKNIESRYTPLEAMRFLVFFCQPVILLFGDLDGKYEVKKTSKFIQAPRPQCFPTLKCHDPFPNTPPKFNSSPLKAMVVGRFRSFPKLGSFNFSGVNSLLNFGRVLGRSLIRFNGTN